METRNHAGGRHAAISNTQWCVTHVIPQEILKRKDEFQFLDSAPYFLNKAEKLVGEDYLPSDDDVLRARSMTTGIVTFPFEVIKYLDIFYDIY